MGPMGGAGGQKGGNLKPSGEAPFPTQAPRLAGRVLCMSSSLTGVRLLRPWPRATWRAAGVASDSGLLSSGYGVRPRAPPPGLLSVSLSPVLASVHPTHPPAHLTLCSWKNSDLPSHLPHAEPQAARMSQGDHLREIPTVQQAQAPFQGSAGLGHKDRRAQWSAELIQGFPCPYLTPQLLPACRAAQEIL